MIVHFKRDKDKVKILKEKLEQEYEITCLDYKEENPFEFYNTNNAIFIFLMSTGIVIRKISNLLEDKWKDNPVLVINRSLDHSIPLLGGHHGSNRLAKKLYTELDIYPAITTATETLEINSLEQTADKLNKNLINKNSSKKINKKIIEEKSQIPIVKVKGPKIVLVDEETAVLSNSDANSEDYVIGIGSKSGIEKEEVLKAIKKTLKSNNFSLSDIRAFSTSKIKEKEEGIIKASKELNKPLFLVPREVINKQEVKSESKASKLGLKGVAEPSALSLSLQNKLVVEKQVIGDVTIAIAK